MTTAMTTTGTISELHEAFVKWSQEMDDDQLGAVIAVFDGLDPDTLGGINKMLMSLTVAMLRGKVSPVVTNSLMPLIDRMIVNIHAMNVQVGRGADTPRAVTAALREAADRARPKPSYTLPEVIDAEVVPAKAKSKVAR